MYKSYFKIGWRNLVKNKGYSLINIGGLAMGMAVAMLIGLWIHDELEFNKYHKNYNSNLWKMLSKDFVVLVVISCLIATLPSYYLLNAWLENYEYRAEISWWIFALTFITSLAITLITVSYQSVKAAMMNPVKSLRSE